VNAIRQANETEVLVRANVTDNVAVYSVHLYFKAFGSNHWVERLMNNTGGDMYEYTIPAQARAGNVTIIYYVNATDTFGNTASTLTDQEQFEIEILGVGTDYTLYYVLGAVLTALMIVLAVLVARKFSGRPKQSPVIDREELPREPEGPGTPETHAEEIAEQPVPEKVDE
jgi:hypothetical protein